jgi:hypothetical protein
VRGEYIITDPFANLVVDQDKAEGYATGTTRVPQIKEQHGLALDSPVYTARLRRGVTGRRTH